MSLQSSLGHIIGLILILLVTSFLTLPVPGLAEALAAVRVQLAMALGVALVYLGLLQRQGSRVKPSVQRVEERRERHR